MRNTRLAGIAVAVGAAVGLLVWSSLREPSLQEFPKDSFGVSELHVSQPDGMSWSASWGNSHYLSGMVDSQDPWFATLSKGASYEARDGELLISGETPRMYIRNPDLTRQWRNIEATMYFKRVADSATPYAGMVAIARANHGVTGDVEVDLCDSRGIGGRVRYDGWSDFEKETSHPSNESAHGVQVWSGEMPFAEFFGYKYLVYDLPNGSVKMEIWLDTTEGRNGGDWKLINQFVDDGTVLGDEPCAVGVDPKMALTNKPDRAGSESGKPNVSVYFRSDDVGAGGLIYKWGSVREILP